MVLDYGSERNSIIQAQEEGRKKPEGGAPAVLSGSLWSADLASTLQELYKPLIDEGFSLSTIARLMMEEANARPRH